MILLSAMDPYEILGITPGASPEEIKAAYRRKANETHPDREGGNAEEFRAIVHSYKSLVDPSYKYEQAGKERDTPVVITVGISLEQALFGATLTNHLVQRQIDTQDEGTGQAPRKGGVTANIHTFTEVIPPRTMRPISRTYAVQLGDRMRNVVVNYQIRDHERYRIREGILYVEEMIDVYLALKGGTTEIQTLFGPRKLRIPPGTQMGDVLRVRNHGFLGDLLVEIQGFRMPNQEELKKGARWQDLEIQWSEIQKQEEEEAGWERKFFELGGSPWQLK